MLDRSISSDEVDINILSFIISIRQEKKQDNFSNYCTFEEKNPYNFDSLFNNFDGKFTEFVINHHSLLKTTLSFYYDFFLY